MRSFLKIPLCFMLSFLFLQSHVGAQQILDFKAGIPLDNFGWATGLSGDGNWLVVNKHPGSSSNALFEIYKKSGNSFEFFQLVPTFQNIGFSDFQFSTDGSRLAVLRGAGYQRPGEIFMYELHDEEFEMIGNSIAEENLLESFGNSGSAFSFSSDGSTVAVGTREYNQPFENGLIEIYRFDGSDWVPKGSRIYGADSERLGSSVDLSADGNRLVVTSEVSFNNKHTKIYEFNGNDWQQIGNIEGCAGHVRITGDGNRVLTLCDRESGFFEQTDTGWEETLPRIDHTEFSPSSFRPQSTDITPDGNHIIFAKEGTVYGYELVQGDWIQRVGPYLNSVQPDLFGSELGFTDDASRMIIGQARYDNLGGKVFYMVPSEERGLKIKPFYDKNLNGIKDGLEPEINNVSLIVDGDYTLLATPYGYLLTGTVGTHTISLSTDSEYSLGQESIEIELGQTSSYDLPLQLGTPDEYFEIRAYATATDYLCNSSSKLTLSIPSWYGETRKVTIELYDKPLVNGGVVLSAWEEEIQSCGSLSVNTVIDMPDETFVGTYLEFLFVIKEYDSVTDELIETYTKDLAGILLCAYDPNDKLVTPIGRESNDLTQKDETLNYRIRFQNTGNLPATNIYLHDELDANLDISSFRVIDASHDLTAVEVGNDRIVKFYFDNINLPDSINSEPESHGYIEFMINPLPGLPELTEITNQAEIYFDLNAPIVTNETRNVMTAFLGTSSVSDSPKYMDFQIAPNPAVDYIQINNDHEIISYKIFDSTGRVFSEGTSIDGNQLIVTDLPTQLYWVIIRTSEGIMKSSFMKL